MSKFEYVFLPVDYLETSAGAPSADVSRVQPAVLVQRLFGFLGLLVVALEDVGPFDTNLAFVVADKILHLGDVNQLYLDARKRRSDLSDSIFT